MQRNREQPLKRGKHMLLGRRASVVLYQGAVSKTRNCVSTLNADNLRSVVDSKSWAWPPVSPVFCWRNPCIKRFVTFKAVRVCLYFLHKYKPCSTACEALHWAQRLIWQGCSVPLLTLQMTETGQNLCVSSSLGKQQKCLMLVPCNMNTLHYWGK